MLYLAFLFDYSFRSSKEVLMLFSRLICAAGSEYEKVVYSKHEWLQIMCSDSVRYNYINEPQSIARICTPGISADYNITMSQGFVKFRLLYNMVALCMNYERSLDESVSTVRKLMGAKVFQSAMENLFARARCNYTILTDVDDNRLKEYFDSYVDDLA